MESTSESSPFPTEFVYVLALVGVGLIVIVGFGVRRREDEPVDVLIEEDM